MVRKVIAISFLSKHISLKIGGLYYVNFDAIELDAGQLKAGKKIRVYLWSHEIWKQVETKAKDEKERFREMCYCLLDESDNSP